MSVSTKSGDTVTVIGNFDGVHRGHAALIHASRGVADAENLPLCVLTFEPHPRSFFHPDDARFRITPAPLKEERLLACGADRVEVMDFNAALSGMTAGEFIDRILVGHLESAHVVVGTDFHFGKGRTGHVDTRQADGRFGVTAFSLVEDEMAAISSTRIRQAIHDGNIAAANDMLGWEWEIAATVRHGDKRGRELGYPTANMDIGDTICPAHGIYAVRTRIDGEDIWRDGVASLGLRPMFKVDKPLLEVFLFDFEGDLYERTLHVRPVAHIREEQKFADMDALIARMGQDVDAAKEILEKTA